MRVLKIALGEDKAYRTPVSSTKGATGHCLGAAGAVEAIFTILALERGVLPPTINQTTPDPTCDLDFIPNEARQEQVEVGGLELVRLRRPQRLPRLPPLARRLSSRLRQPQLQEQRVAPDAVELGDPLAPPDDPEPRALVQREAGRVLGEDARLDRPDPYVRRRLHEGPHQRRADAAPTRTRGDVDAVLGDTRIAGPAARPVRARPTRRRSDPARRRAVPVAAARCRRTPTWEAPSRTSRSRSRFPRPRCPPREASPPPSSLSARFLPPLRASIDFAPMRIRRPDPAVDFEGALALVQACDRAVYGDTDWTEGELRGEWAGLDLGRDAWVAEAEGRLAGLMHLYDRHGGRMRADGYVHPELTGRGAGSRLLAAAEERALERAGAEPAGVQVTIETAHLVGDPRAPKLLTCRGYSHVRTFHRMVIDLDRGLLPEPAFPAGLELRPFDTERDAHALRAALDEAFAEEWGYEPRRPPRLARARARGRAVRSVAVPRRLGR